MLQRNEFGNRLTNLRKKGSGLVLQSLENLLRRETTSDETEISGFGCDDIGGNSRKKSNNRDCDREAASGEGERDGEQASEEHCEERKIQVVGHSLLYERNMWDSQSAMATHYQPNGCGPGED